MTGGQLAQQDDYRDTSQSSLASSDDSTPAASLVSSQSSQSSIATEETGLDDLPISEALQVSEELLEPSKYSRLPEAVKPPFCGPRGYHIPSTRFSQALSSPAYSRACYWQHGLYQGPGQLAEKVKIDYCRTKESMEMVAQHFLNEEVIGFDIEWVSYAKETDGIKKNVSLIQIASEERIALFHLARFPGADEVENLVTPAFKTLMESSSTSKVGVVIKGDTTRLRKFLGIECQGLLELSNLHKLVLYCSGELEKVDRRFVKLSEQVQTHLGLPLHKGPVRLSDWTRDLRPDQVDYAASDAYANLQLFYALETKRKAFYPIPPRPVHAELKRPSKRLKKNPEISQGLSDSSGLPSLVITSSSSGEPSSTPAPPHPYAKELEQAKSFIDSYTAAQNPSISPRALRSYCLWHQQGLDIPTVAGILRTPPVLQRTVIGYLCDALSSLPIEFQCSPEKIRTFSTVYGFQAYKRPHKDLIAWANRECAKAK